MDWQTPDMKTRDIHDDYVVRENTEKHVYFKHGFLPHRTDVWLDCGGNIGAFCCSVGFYVNHIYSYEPEPANYALLCENVKRNLLNERVTCFNKAVIGTQDRERNLYLTSGDAKSLHSLIPSSKRKSIPVSCANVNSVLLEHHITCFKIDIEGGEAEIIRALFSEALVNVRWGVIEYHSSALHDKTSEIYNELLARLRTLFSGVKARKRISSFPSLIWVCSPK